VILFFDEEDEWDLRLAAAYSECPLELRHTTERTPAFAADQSLIHLYWAWQLQIRQDHLLKVLVVCLPYELKLARLSRLVLNHLGTSYGMIASLE